MAKLTLANITSGYLPIVTVNANSDAIEAAFENTLSRDGTSPNTMGANLDMNSHQIINVGSPSNPTAAARLVDILDADTTGAASAQLKIDLGASSGSSLIGFLSDLPGATADTVEDELRYEHRVTQGGMISDGELSGYTGTDNTSAFQALVAEALSLAPDGTPGQGGMTLNIPEGMFVCEDQVDFKNTGASYIGLKGTKRNSFLIFPNATDRGLNFTTADGTWDGTYSNLHSRISLEDIALYGLPASAPAGTTKGVAFEYCGEVNLKGIKPHYFETGISIKDTPNAFLDDCEANNCNLALYINQTTGTGRDIAPLTVRNFICSSNSASDTVGGYIDGGRDILFLGGSFNVDIDLKVTAVTNRVELVRMVGSNLDFSDTTNPSVIIGTVGDVYEIKHVSLDTVYFNSNTAMTKPLIRVDGPYVDKVSVNGGYVSIDAGFTGNSGVRKFMVLSSTCNPDIEVSIKGLSEFKALEYAVLDERFPTKRSELFEMPPSLQLNPDMNYQAPGYPVFGYTTNNPTYVGTNYKRFVTGHSSISLGAAVSPTAIPNLTWYPKNGETYTQPLGGNITGDVVAPGTELVIEWIAKTATTTPRDVVRITLRDIDGGSGSESVVSLDQYYKNMIQSYTGVDADTGGDTTGFERWIGVYKVPSDKVLMNVYVSSNGYNTVGNTTSDAVVIDYFNVYGPEQYKPEYLIFPVGIGATAAFNDPAGATTLGAAASAAATSIQVADSSIAVGGDVLAIATTNGSLQYATVDSVPDPTHFALVSPGLITASSNGAAVSFRSWDNPLLRGLTVLKRDPTGTEADELYQCNKDAGAATYTWVLIA